MAIVMMKIKFLQKDPVVYIKTVVNFLDVTIYYCLFIEIVLCTCKFLCIYTAQRAGKLYPFDPLCMTLKYQANWRRNMIGRESSNLWGCWLWRAVAGASAFFSKMNQGFELPLAFWHYFFFLPQVIPLRRKVKKDKEVSNRGKERWQFHWDKSEKISLPASKFKGMLFKGPALGNEWTKCPDKEILAGSWKGQKCLDAFEDSLEKLVRPVIK